MARRVEMTDIWIERIKDQLSGLIFGNVQILIHDGQIVQLEQTERVRYQDSPPTTPNRNQNQQRLNK